MSVSFYRDISSPDGSQSKLNAYVYLLDLNLPESSDIQENVALDT